MDTAEARSQALVAHARSLGFDHCGIAPAAALDAEAADLRAFLAEGRHGSMDWLARDPGTRTDPRRLLPGAQSVVVVLKNYFPKPAERQPPHLPRISTYAYGHDYHHVLKRGLHHLADWLQQQHPHPVATRACVDSAPFMDKAWARRAGLGWLGKHTNLIRPDSGSYFFIGALLCDVALAPTAAAPMDDYCGTCTRCLDACPTQALTPYRIDARKCISYRTIEQKTPLSTDPDAPATHGWAYGCDICQDVCPWNRFAKPHTDEFFRPLQHVHLTPAEWAALNPSQYKKLTRPTAMSRVRRDKLLDNLHLADEYLHRSDAPPASVHQ